MIREISDLKSLLKRKGGKIAGLSNRTDNYAKENEALRETAHDMNLMKKKMYRENLSTFYITTLCYLFRNGFVK